MAIWNFGKPASGVAPGFIRAAHYFGDQWPVNFWSSFDWERVPGDMAQIRNDGFNAVILVIPWYPFSPAGGAETLPFYNAGARHVMQAAQDAGLDIILRVSYPHDTLGDVSSAARKRCAALMMRDPDVTALWKASLQNVHRIASEFDRYRYAFFSWEDMWCAIKDFPNTNAADRRSAAKRTGFQDHAFDTLGKDLAAYLGGRPIDTAGEISIPQRRTPLFMVYKQFVEGFFARYLIPLGREAIPNLGFETRLDREPIDTASGDTHWSGYDLFPHDGLRASYWAPFMGQKNIGETIDAATALRSLKRVLDRLTDNGARQDHLMEQFNFIGNTPEFGHSARIKETDIANFLKKAAKLLQQQTAGYGLWTYRDYRHNYVANAAFSMGLAAYALEGDGRLVESRPKGKSLRVDGTATLGQRIAFQASLDHMRKYYDPLTFCLSATAESPRRFKVGIQLNDEPVGNIEGIADGSKRRFCQQLTFRYAGPERFARLRMDLDAQGVLFDDIMLFNHLQKGGIYGADGAPGPYLAFIRELNQRLGAG